MAKCPYCNNHLGHINLDEVTSSAFMGDQWRTVIYSCPSCQSALSVGIDPISLKADAVEEILEALRKR